MGKNSPKIKKDKPPLKRLAQFFQRNGYIRHPNQKLIKRLGGKKYKKGYEVRLVAKTRSELALMRSLIKQIKMKPGKPFSKGRQFAQPIYGKKAVEQFLKWHKGK